MKVAALETFLFGLTAYSAFKFLSSEQWQTSVTWWTATMICLLNFWVLGVPSLLRYGILIFSGLALANQFSNTLTPTHLAIGLAIILITIILCHSQYAADVLWSIKTIVIDWLVCTFLVIITAVIDAIQGNQNLVLVMAYFCSSNIFSVVVMKACETLLKWRSPEGVPCARYIHNLSIPIPLLPSLHVGQLLTVAWILALLLVGKIEYFFNSENVNTIPGWHLMAASGFWGGLFCYMCPIIANKNPAPYLGPPPPAVSEQTLRQRRQN